MGRRTNWSDLIGPQGYQFLGKFDVARTARSFANRLDVAHFHFSLQRPTSVCRQWVDDLFDEVLHKRITH
jgi:hypothetical protein